MPLNKINLDSTSTQIRSSNFRSYRSIQKWIEKNLVSLIGERTPEELKDNVMEQDEGL